MSKRVPYPVEVLWCGNSRGNGWSFPVAVRGKLKADFEGKRVLHLFGGRADFGVRQDLDPVVRPDVIADAWLPPFARDSFDVVILDPPYIHLNVQMKTLLFRAASWIAREHVVWFSNIWASQSGGLKTERAWLVRVGDSCHIRCLQYFRVVSKSSEPYRPKYFNRGPAMKYNRWLIQPECLPLMEASESDDRPGSLPA